MLALVCTCCEGRVGLDPPSGLYKCWHCGTAFIVEDGDEIVSPGPYYEERTREGLLINRLSATEIRAMYRLSVITKAEALFRLTGAGYTEWQSAVLLASEDFRLELRNS